MDISEQLEQEENLSRYEQEFEANRQIAVEFGWNFATFRTFIKRFISEQTEDQWIYDYEAYCSMLAGCWETKQYYMHPLEFGKFHYQQRWDKVEFAKALESLNQVAEKFKK